MSFPPCPQCHSEYTYPDGSMLVCPECAYEWDGNAAASAPDDGLLIRDANGNRLSEGDTVTLIKDLKVKGTSSVIKIGSKAKIYRLVDGDHNIDCRVEGMGEMMLKSEFVKKA